jgi:Uncharacterized protein conserved in bacteria (DUF2062)
MSTAIQNDEANAQQHSLIYKRLVAPIIALLTQGITPEKLALSLAVGLVVGVFPVLGSTTFLCALAAVVFRLNLPAVQLVNYVAYPLQLLFVVPFIRLGEKLYRAVPLNLSLAQMLVLAHDDLHHAISVLWIAGLHATSAWFLIGPPTIFVLYFVLARTLRHFANVSQLHNTPAGVA